MKKLLLIVPHQDDEINIFGTINSRAVKEQIETSVIFVTNGDYYSEKTKKRMMEAADSCKLQGISHVYYLGYGVGSGDNCCKHIYDTREKDEIVISKAGKDKTYGVGNSVDFAMLFRGKHSPYKFSSLKNDLKSCIKKVNPDIIICNDYDSHPDHRMVSIISDEIIGELVKENSSFKPIYLKKFSYVGVWSGIADYFTRPMKETTEIAFHESDSSFFNYYDTKMAVRINVNKEMYERKESLFL